jgi:hypothetical protein
LRSWPNSFLVEFAPEFLQSPPKAHLASGLAYADNRCRFSKGDSSEKLQPDDLPVTRIEAADRFGNGAPKFRPVVGGSRNGFSLGQGRCVTTSAAKLVDQTPLSNRVQQTKLARLSDRQIGGSVREHLLREILRSRLVSRTRT